MATRIAGLSFSQPKFCFALVSRKPRNLRSAATFSTSLRLTRRPPASTRPETSSLAKPWREARALITGLFQPFDQEEDFGGHRVVQIRGVGEGVVAAAGNDGLEGLDEGAEAGGQIRSTGEFLQE